MEVVAAAPFRNSTSRVGLGAGAEELGETNYFKKSLNFWQSAT